MKLLSRLVALGALMVLPACGTWHAESYLNEEIAGDGFNACLAREYQDRATSEAYVDCNWTDTAKIVAKGRAAQDNQLVLPFDPAIHGVLPGDLGALQDARTRLMAALDNGGREGNRACQCAKAQRYYDGWVEQASDNDVGVGGALFGWPGGPVQPGRVKAEQAAFFEALTDCEVVKVGPWSIYFGFNRWDLTAEAQAVVDAIADISGNRSLSVMGYTDTSGSRNYNQSLGLRRAGSVAKVLRERDANVGLVGSQGQDGLAVETGDGKREPLNRRVIITID